MLVIFRIHVEVGDIKAGFLPSDYGFLTSSNMAIELVAFSTKP